jgi:hypothetical protein
MNCVVQNITGWEGTSLVVSIIAAIIAIASICQAIYLRRKTKKESEEQFNFMANLVMYSTDDPDAVYKKLQEYRKSGTWGPVQVIRLSNGKLNFAFNEELKDGVKLQENLDVKKVK